MSKIIANRSDIVAIADAVRSKAGITDALTLEDIATEISNIEGGTDSAFDPTDENLYPFTYRLDLSKKEIILCCISYTKLKTLTGIGDEVVIPAKLGNFDVVIASNFMESD